MPPLKNRRYPHAVLFIAAALFFQLAGAQLTPSFDSILQTIKAIKNDSVRKKALFNYEKEISREQPQNALVLDSLLIIEARKTHNKQDEMKSLYGMALDYNMLNDYPASISYSFKALDLAVQLKDRKVESEIYLNQSNVYAMIKDTANELQTINKALAIALADNDSAMMGDAYNELGIYYSKLGNTKLAIQNLQTSIDISAAINKNERALETYVNMAIVFKNSRQFDKAKQAYNRSLVMADSTHDSYIKAVIIDNMANLEFEMGDYATCEKHALQSIGMSYQVQEKSIRTDLYALLEKLYEKEKRYPEAIQYFSKLADLKDSLLNEEKLAQIGEMDKKFQTALKDKQITTQQAQINNQRKLNLILGGGGVAIAIIAGLIYGNQRRTAKLNNLISAQRDALSRQSETLSVMMKELHHRVKNNLQIVASLLNLQSQKLTDDGAIIAVQESKQRVQAMSLIHQRLYKTDDITRINMREYINELADFLAISYGYNPDNFSLRIDVEEEWADIDRALPLGLILNELVTNAFKYAFIDIERPELYIGFKHDDNNNINLVVKDNGKGIDPALWNTNQSGSFGRQLVKALTGQLRAKEKLDVNNGTRFTFVIPVAA